MTSIKKYVSEFIGTAVLVIMGCGTAMLVGCDTSGGYALTALAFGLVIVGMAYCVGNISGCHINPAVSLAVLIRGDMNVKDFVGYVISQCLGALTGSGLLALIFNLSDVDAGAYGTNGISGVGDSLIAAFIIEVILTFIFVLTIIGVTSKKANHGSFGGIIIGFTLTLVHILGIGFTGTSVNPARSLGPAIVSAIAGNTDAISCVWVFILAPLAGALIAALVYGFLESEKE